MNSVKILCCMPTTGFIYPKTFTSIIKLKKPEGVELHWAVTEDSLVYHARNIFVERALNGEYDYIFMVDSDMVLPEDTLIRLLADDKDIVSGLAFKRRFPHEPACLSLCRVVENIPVFKSMSTWEPGELKQVEGVGSACILIKTDVFKALGEINWYMPTLEFSEDYSFCLRATEEGFKIFVDTSLVVGHIGEQVFGEEHYRTSLEYMKGGEKE